MEAKRFKMEPCRICRTVVVKVKDAEPHKGEKSDPDPHLSEKMDPDPHQRDAGPQTLQLRTTLCRIQTSSSR
jgi:hypothetical protein